MNKLEKLQSFIFCFIIILLAARVNADEYRRYYAHIFDECINLTVTINATLPIDPFEYIIINEYNQIGNNTYFINCTNNYTLLIYFKNNAINNYTITMTNYYAKTVEKTGTGGGSGSRSSKKICTSNYNCTGWTDCINSFKKRDCTDINKCSNNYTEVEKCSTIPIIDLPDIAPISTPFLEEEVQGFMEIPPFSTIIPNTSQDNSGGSPFYFKIIIISIVIIFITVIIMAHVFEEKKREYEL